jgi:hypothetical protein
MDKGFLYYTDNSCQKRIMAAVCRQLNKCRNGAPLVSVSQSPMDFGANVVLPLQSSILSMFKQMLIGLILLDTKVVFCVEHDVLYHPSHFDFTPASDHIFYFNKNVWSVNSDTGEALHYDGMKKTSCLVANRDLLIEHYTQKIRTVEKDGWSNRIGFEPGKKRGNFEYFESASPNIDIKHGKNLTRWRNKLSQYRCRARIKDSWILTDRVPHWGKTSEILRGMQC